MKALYDDYGTGRYVYIAQGNNGHTVATVDLYTLILGSGDTMFFMVSANTYNGAQVVFNAYSGYSTTFDFNISYASNCRCISKVCSFI